MGHRGVVVGGLAALALTMMSAPRAAQAVVCDGSELLCLNMTSAAEITAAGGTVVGGSFDPTGFQPSNQGGIDWSFGPGTDFSWGRLEMDVTGLLPVDAGELDGGKVSLFTFCGEPPDDTEYIGFQKMPPDYRDGHIWRFGMDDDELADNWDAVIITGAGFNCYYSINDPAWLPGDTHHIVAEWDGSGLTMTIDGWQCSKPGNGDTFDPAAKLFVVGNRCQHYPNQHPVARLSNLRLWALSHNPGCDPAAPMTAVSLTPSSGTGESAALTAIYGHCQGADELRRVLLRVADSPDSPGEPAVEVAYEAGQLELDGQTCAPGDPTVLQGQHGRLHCGSTTVAINANDEELTVTWVLDFDGQTFGGTHDVYLDAHGGAASPEPRLGWTLMGSHTVPQSTADAGVIAPDGGPAPDGGVTPDGGADGPSTNVSTGCSCRHSTPPAAPSALVLLFLWAALFHRRRH